MKSLIALIALTSTPALAQQPTESAALEAATEELDGPDTWWHCRRLLGLTGGAYERPQSWSFQGRGAVQFSGSPMFALTCDYRMRGIAITAGAETAPLFSHAVLGSTDRTSQWLSISGGVLFHRSERLALGPLATVGWGRVGLGARMLHLPWGEDERPMGLEYRLQMTLDTGVGVQASVLGTLSSTRKGK
ncbi:MAG: hypothetical protein AB8H79_23265 [Myxococcota bacterium]